ncbi:MAG: helix-turn-helix transcriptional regulator, partial [Acidimicrobiales bacterium]
MAGDPRRDRLERLTNLVLVLLDTSHLLSLREITATVDGYPDEHEAARQAFERDKRALRELGIPVSVEPLAGEEQSGYRIHPEEYFLRELDLDEEEAQALAFAVAAVQLGGTAGRDALSKLGHGDDGELFDGTVGPLAVLPSLPALGAVHGALSSRGLLSFRYHGREREVEAYGLTFRNAAWYLVARDRTAGTDGEGAMRTFRVDRFESPPAVAEPGSFEPPADFDLKSEVRLLPFPSPASGEMAEVPLAEIVVDARLSRSVEAQVHKSAVAERREDGSILLHLAVGDEDVFVSYVLGLGDTAVVTSPPELVAAVTSRLRRLVAEGGGPSPSIPGEAGQGAAAGPVSPRRDSDLAAADPRSRQGTEGE